MKKLYFFLILFLFATKGITQNIKDYVSIASPNASSLGAYGETPVSLSSGTAGVSVPIYQLKDGKINVPIGLSYNTSGIKPDQHSGWVGQNWSLNAGGVITRIPKSIPDETAWTEDIYLSTNQNFVNNKRYGYMYYRNLLNNGNWSTQTNVDNLANADNWVDTEPDEFIFNFNGISGKFMIERDGKCTVLSDPTMRVEMEDTLININDPHYFASPIISNIDGSVYLSEIRIRGFKITTSDGTQYEFGYWNQQQSLTNFPIEGSIDFFQESYFGENWDSWYLIRIVSPNNLNTVKFKYDLGDPIITIGNSIAMSKDFGSSTSRGIFDIFGPVSASSFSVADRNDGRLIYPVYLKKIDSENIEINFTKSVSNELKYNYNGIASQLAFQHEQIYSPNIHSFPARFVIAGRWSDRFNAGVLSFPRKDIKVIDELTGQPLLNNNTQFQYNSFFLENPSRPYSPASDYYPVTGLVYPTNSIYIHEIVDFNKLKWSKLDKIEIKNKLTNQVVKTFDLKYNNTSTERLMLMSVQEKGINVATDTLPPYKFEYEDYNSNYYSGTTKLPNYISNRTDHWGFFNNVDARSYLGNAFSTSGYDETKLIGYKNQREPVSQYLYAGILNKITYPTGGSTRLVYEPNTYDKTIIRNVTTGIFSLRTEPSAKIAGGLRIKEIQTNPNDGTPNIVRQYQYFDGILGGDIQYFWKNHQSKLKGTSNTFTSDRFISQSLLPVSSNNSSNLVGYSKVVESMIGNGKTEYLYSNHDSNIDENFLYSVEPDKSPYSPFTSKDVERGRLLKKTLFRENGDKVREEINTYAPLDASAFIRCVATKQIPIFDGGVTVEGTSYKVYKYPYILTNTTVNSFDLSDITNQKKVVVNNQNYYNILGKLSQTIRGETDGSDFITKYKYSSDYSTTIALSECSSNRTTCENFCLTEYTDINLYQQCIQDCSDTYISCINFQSFDEPSKALVRMNEANINPIIEKQESRKLGSIEKTIGGTMSIYGRFNYAGLQLSKLYKLHLDNPIDVIPMSEIGALREFNYDSKYKRPELIFEKYDERGNLLQAKKEYDIPTSFIYGYKNTLPVAEMKGITYDNAVTLITPTVINELKNSNLTETQVTTKLSPLLVGTDKKVNLYTHDVVYGVTTMIDPRGVKTSYQYDGLGRLKTVKDKDGFILKNHSYQYAGASTGGTGCTVAAPTITATPASTGCNIILTASACSGTTTWSNTQIGNTITVPSVATPTYTATCTTTCISPVSNALAGLNLPSGWNPVETGTGVNGCTILGNSQIKMNAAPSGGIGGSDPDTYYYMDKQYSGNITIIAKISSMSTTASIRAGLMFRSSNSIKSPFFQIVQAGDNVMRKFY